MKKLVPFSCLMLFFLVGCSYSTNDADEDLTGAVSITGIARVGETLTAVIAGLNGTGKISYQWQRGDAAKGDFKDIGGATAKTYIPADDDADLHFVVVVSRAGYTGSITSAAKGPVAAAVPPDDSGDDSTDDGTPVDSGDDSTDDGTPVDSGDDSTADGTPVDSGDDSTDDGTPDTAVMPIVYIDTENNAQIVSKDTYLNATIRVIEGSVTTTDSAVKIKGRGNWTWEMSKKPYKLKFDSKTALLGMPKDKEWVLLANWNDITALRTDTALFMGSLSNLEWTPRAKFAEVYLNGAYNGLYQVCEQVKIAADRVNVTDNGYLLEIEMFQDRRDADIAAGDVYISTGRLFLNMKDGSSDSTTIENYVRNIETLLYSSNTPGTTNYAQSLDIPSFADYYLVNEIYQRNDPMMSSCFLHMAPGGKLKMGPLWDFDGDRTGYWENTVWFEQLFKDPAFVSQVKTRFAYFKSQKSTIINHIDTRAAYLKSAVERNNSHWSRFMSDYNNEVQADMKDWLDQRFTSVETQINGL